MQLFVLRETYIEHCGCPLNFDAHFHNFNELLFGFFETGFHVAQAEASLELLMLIQVLESQNQRQVEHLLSTYCVHQLSV